MRIPDGVIGQEGVFVVEDNRARFAAVEKGIVGELLIEITSGLEEKIKRGLVIGKIKSIKKENNELWQITTIEPQYQKEDLIMVSVVLP